MVLGVPVLPGIPVASGDLVVSRVPVVLFVFAIPGITVVFEVLTILGSR